MRARMHCGDKYEAQKLASLILVRDSKETNITSVLNAVENEVVIALRDKSAHSILFRDESNAEIFADFIQSVIEGGHAIVRVSTHDTMVQIEKA